MEEASKPHAPKTIQEKLQMDPVRQAAIAALKARRGAENKKEDSTKPGHSKDESPGPITAAKPTSAVFTKTGSGKLKLKFVIPKRDTETIQKKRKSRTVVSDSESDDIEPKDALASSSKQLDLPLKKPKLAMATAEEKTEAPRKAPSLKRPASRRSIGAAKTRGIIVEDAHAGLEGVQEAAEMREPNELDRAASDQHVSPTLYLGDLPPACNEDILWEDLGMFDGIVDVQLHSGDTRYAIIHFENVDAAQAAVDFAAEQGGGLPVAGSLAPLAWAGGAMIMDNYMEDEDVGPEGGEYPNETEAVDFENSARTTAAATQEYAEKFVEDLDEDELAELRAKAQEEERSLVSYDDL